LQLSDCFSHEGLIRSVYFSKEMSRENGFEVLSAMNNDVTGFSWASPQVLSRAGVKYFATGINETRSRAPLRRPCAFYWESPDGSRVLHWNGEHYLFANYDLQLHEASEQSAPRLGEYLGRLQARGDYPYDTIAFNISAWVTDNCPPGRALSDRVRDWNSRFASPKLRLATMREFFEPFEKKYSATIPVHKLGWPDYWTDGVASTAYETGLNRLAHNELLTAEKLAAVAGALDPSFAYPRDEINEAYDNSMLYDEHTWGAYNSIDNPHSELARGQWAHKSSFAYIARETAATLSRKSIEHIAARIPAESEFSFLVFNPLSWKRTDVAKIDLPVPFHDKEGTFQLLDGRTGKEVVYQLVPKEPGKEKAAKDAMLFLARDIPAMGYATYSLVPNKNPETVRLKTVIRGNVVENPFYKVTIDDATGGISSLIDKETNLELVDKSSPFHLNMYIYENPVGGRRAVDNMELRARFNRSSPTSALCVPGFQGAVASSIIAKSSPRMCSALEQEIIRGETGADEMLAKRLVNLANSLRALKEHDLEEAASTRLVVYAASLIKSGFDPVEACRAAMVETLTDDDETAAALMEIVLVTFGQ